MRYLYIALFVCLGSGLMAQTQIQDTLNESPIHVSGFYRFFGTYTNYTNPYTLIPANGQTTLQRSFFIGDDAQLPNLLLNVAGKVGENTNWGFDLRMFQFLNGTINPAYGTQVADSLRPSFQKPLGTLALGGNLGNMLGMTLYGDFKTRVGNWSVKVGGIQWVNISDLTFASFRGYNRFMLFERNPWDPMGRNVSARYQQYFDQGSIDQDMRWGNRAFEGAVVQGSDLPGKTSVLAMIGKTELNGGFSQVPNYSYGGKIRKALKGSDFVALNTFNNAAYTDSLEQTRYGFHVLTAEGNIHVGDHLFKFEVGGGKYFSPDHNRGWGEVMQFRYVTPERNNRPSLEVHYFRVSPKVVNNSALYWNTATREYSINNIPAGSVGSSSILQPFGSSMIRVGQLTNNRQGLNLNAQWMHKKWKFSAGVGSSAELEAAAAVITVGHPVNQFTRSRLWRWNFPAGVGPYGRYSDIYRDVYQTINLLDDSSGVVKYKKFFNNAEMQIKYKSNIGSHDFYVFSLLQAQSCQRTFSPVLVTTEKAYVRQYSSEIEAYLSITKGFALSAYAGFERTLGNYLTDINEDTHRPMNQTGKGLGLGADFDLGRNTRLYVRDRWFYFNDKSFPLDHFQGNELVVELKAFF
jgi:tRNA U38,U39,U40 pseudouridine synthase TruA